MPIPNSMGIVPPVVGTTPGPTWANELNTILTDKVADHNHTGTPNGGQLSQAALNITGDLPLNNNGLTATKRVALSTQVSSPGAQSLWSNGGNLYWTPAAGSAVQITNGSTINVAAFGGISGLPNGTAGASYNAAGYYKWNKSTTAYADMWAGKLKIYDSAAAAPTNAVVLSSPTSLAAEYTLTLPAALPSAGITGSLQVNSNGVMSVYTPVSASANFAASSWTSGAGTLLATATITATGRPILVMIQPQLGAANAGVLVYPASGVLANTLLACRLVILCNAFGTYGSSAQYTTYLPYPASASPSPYAYWNASLSYIIPPGLTGTQTFTIYGIIDNANTSATCSSYQLLVREL